MKRPARLDYLRDVRGKWRWHLMACNGLCLDASSQGYATKSGAKKNFIRTRDAMNAVEV